MNPMTVKCSDCRHYKDRYTLFMHGPYPKLRKLLELNLIDERDFICEGWGCVYHPLEDFAHDDHMEPIFPDDLPPHPCEYFEPLKSRQELAKNILFESEYMSQRALDEGKKVKHLDISEIPCGPVRRKACARANSSDEKKVKRRK